MVHEDDNQVIPLTISFRTALDLAGPERRPGSSDAERSRDGLTW